MTADKRPVHTDALATLGTIIDETAARDAIHLAVEPMVAGETLQWGASVVVRDGKAYWAHREEAVGIVDPFLDVCGSDPIIAPGRRFWLILLPRTITSLRHVWTHPDFDDEPEPAQEPEVDEKEEAERWLRRYAEEIDEGFNTLMQAAEAWLDRGEYFYGARTGDYYGKFEGESVHPDFWKHYQVYRGRVVPAEDQESFFTCSC